MQPGLVDFYHYNLWANLHLLNACAKLTDAQLDFTMEKGVYGSIRQTIQHMLGAEERYIEFFTMTGPVPQPPLNEMKEFAGFDELRRRAERSGKWLITIAEQGGLDEVFTLASINLDFPGIIAMIQAINHTVDHRSQISTLLTLQGIEPPSLDSWSYQIAMNKVNNG